MDGSIFAKLGIPSDFILLLIIFSFILMLAPYFSGMDFGIFMVPQFSQQTKSRLRIFGPLLFALCIIFNFPLSTETQEISPGLCVESPSNSKLEVTVFAPPSNVRNTPNGKIILCRVDTIKKIKIYGEICSPYSGWYFTDVCNGQIGAIHISQIRFQ